MEREALKKREELENFLRNSFIQFSDILKTFDDIQEEDFYDKILESLFNIFLEIMGLIEVKLSSSLDEVDDFYIELLNEISNLEIQFESNSITFFKDSIYLYLFSKFKSEIISKISELDSSLKKFQKKLESNLELNSIGKKLCGLKKSVSHLQIEKDLEKLKNYFSDFEEFLIKKSLNVAKKEFS